LAEIVERTYPDGRSALADLRRGKIDVLDRLFPADVAQLRGEASPQSPIVIAPYALPTVHMLIVNEQNPLLANHDFRRALVFAIHRQQILEQELLGGRSLPGCRVISGPFPARTGERDPLSYAYDEALEPRQYAPFLARLLISVARNQLAESAAAQGAPVTEPAPLVLGYPAHEAARVACQAIATHLEAVGLACRLKELPPGMARDPGDACDLTYAEVAIWEPLADARQLLGRDGLARSSDPYIHQALQALDEAQDWSEVRQRLLDLHRISHHEATVIPLWQTVEFFAYRRRLRNIGERPVSLYQQIDQWRLASDVPAE
jgi:ABC-type transport system substrate-binding protein